MQEATIPCFLFDCVENDSLVLKPGMKLGDKAGNPKLHKNHYAGTVSRFITWLVRVSPKLRPHYSPRCHMKMHQSYSKMASFQVFFFLVYAHHKSCFKWGFIYSRFTTASHLSFVEKYLTVCEGLALTNSTILIYIKSFLRAVRICKKWLLLFVLLTHQYNVTQLLTKFL